MQTKTKHFLNAILVAIFTTFVCCAVFLFGGLVKPEELASSEQPKVQNQLTLTNDFSDNKYIIIGGKAYLYNQPSSQTTGFTTTEVAIRFDANNKLELIFMEDNVNALSSFAVSEEKIASILTAEKTSDEVEITITDKYDEVSIITSDNADYVLGELALATNNNLSFTNGKFTLNSKPTTSFTATAKDTAKVASVSAGTISISGSKTYSPKSGEKGRAIYQSGGTLTLTTVTLSGFSVTGNGGAIYQDSGTLNLNCTITGCSASAQGGAVYSKGTVSVTGGTVSNNTAGSGGGAFCKSGGTATFSNATVQNNITTGSYGHAIYADGGATVNVNSGTYATQNSSYPNATVIVGNATMNLSGGTLKGYNYVFDCFTANEANAKYVLKGNPTLEATSGNHFWLSVGTYLRVETSLTKAYTVVKNGVTSIDDGDAARSYVSYSTNSTYLTSAKNKITVSNYSTYHQHSTAMKSNYLVCEYKSYTASFNGNGGSNGTSITKKHKAALGTLPSSTRTGYTFNGWFTATSGGTQISSTTTMPSANTTYYAQWTINSYTLHIFKGQENLLSAAEMAKAGTGSPNNNCTTTYSPANGGTWTSTPANTSDPFSTIPQTVSLTANTKYYIHMTIRNADGSIPSGSIQLFLAINRGYNETNSVRFHNGGGYAEYTPTTTGVYNMRMDNDYSGRSVVVTNFWVSSAAATNYTTATVNYAATYDLGTPSRTGHTFDGWTVATGTYTMNNKNSATTISGSASVSGNTVTMGAGNAYVFANYDRNTYTVTISRNNTSYGTVSASSVTAYYGAAVSTSGATLTVGGSSVTATATAATGYTTSFSSWSNATGSITADRTITANFTRTANSYTLTINPNGGTYGGKTSNTTVTQNYNTTYTVSNPTRTGYTFSSWSKSGSGTLSGTTFTFGAGNCTLTASWSINYYNVRLDTYIDDSLVGEDDLYGERLEVWIDVDGDSEMYWGYQDDLAYGTEVYISNISIDGNDGDVIDDGVYYLMDAYYAFADYAEFTVDSDLVIEVYFYTALYITIGRSSNYGTVSTSSILACYGSYVYDYGDDVIAFDMELENNNGAAWVTRLGTVSATPGTSAGYTVSFSKWTFDGPTGTQISGINHLYSDREIYANFSRTGKIITITLNNQSATSAGTTAIYYRYYTNAYYSNSSLSTSLSSITKPTRTGYTFGGYYSSTNGGGTQYITSSGSPMNSLYASFTSNTTLYAKWTLTSYTISYQCLYSPAHGHDVYFTVNGSTYRGSGSFTYNVSMTVIAYGIDMHYDSYSDSIRYGIYLERGSNSYEAYNTKSGGNASYTIPQSWLVNNAGKTLYAKSFYMEGGSVGYGTILTTYLVDFMVYRDGTVSDSTVGAITLTLGGVSIIYNTGEESYAYGSSAAIQASATCARRTTEWIDKNRTKYGIGYYNNPMNGWTSYVYNDTTSSATKTLSISIDTSVCGIQVYAISYKNGTVTALSSEASNDKIGSFVNIELVDEPQTVVSTNVWLDDKFRKLQEPSETEVDFDGVSFM